MAFDFCLISGDTSSPLGKQMDIKSGQWFGAVVQSSGANGTVLVSSSPTRMLPFSKPFLLRTHKDIIYYYLLALCIARCSLLSPPTPNRTFQSRKVINPTSVQLPSHQNNTNLSEWSFYFKSVIIYLRIYPAFMHRNYP